MTKPPKKKWKSLSAAHAGSGKDRLLAWAERWSRIEKARVKGRVAIARANRIEEHVISEWIDTISDRGAVQLAAVLSRTAADAELVAVLAARPSETGWAAVVWGWSREGEFFSREYSVQVNGKTLVNRTKDLTEEAFAKYGDFTELGFFVDPALEDMLAEKGCPGAQRSKPKPSVPLAFAQEASAVITSEARPREERARATFEHMDDFPWETGRLHAAELEDLTLGVLASEPFACSPGARPEGLARRTLDDLTLHGWTDEADAIWLVGKVANAKDPLGALRFFLGSSVPPLAKMYACACAAHAGRSGGDRALSLEAGAALVRRLDDVGDPAAWLAAMWSDKPTHRDLVVTVATASLALGAFWRIAQVLVGSPVFPLPESSPILRAVRAAEAVRDLLLDRAGAPRAASAGERIVKLGELVHGSVPSRHGEPRITKWVEAAHFDKREPPETMRRNYVALQAAALHAVVATVPLELARGHAAYVQDLELWRPDTASLDGLLQPALEAVARHIVQRAAYEPSSDRAVGFLERARAVCDWKPVFACLYDEARFRAGRWDEALLADLEKETSATASLGAAAEFLRVAERLQRPRETRIARKRLLGEAKGTSLEWAARVRVAFGRPHIISDVDRVIELELDAPSGLSFDSRERAVFAVLEDGSLDDLVRQVTEQRLALEKQREDPPDWTATVYGRLRSIWPLLARSAGNASSLRKQALDLEARIAQDGDREGIERDIVALLESAQAFPEMPLDLEDDADEDDFKRMVLAPWALQRSEKDLATPSWALLKGMQGIARWNASRGQRRDVKRLQGYRQCEIRLPDARNPVRVSYLLTSSGPIVAGIYAKQDDAHQKRMLDRIEGWLAELLD